MRLPNCVPHLLNCCRLSRPCLPARCGAVPAGGRGSPGAAARPGGGEPGSRRGPCPPARADVRKLSGLPWPERAPGAARRGGGTGGAAPSPQVRGGTAGLRAGQPLRRGAEGRARHGAREGGTGV